MRENENRQEVEIDLLKLFGAYLHRWWLIVLCGVLIAAGTWIFSTRFITPMYRAGVTIYVNNTSSGERVESITSGNLSVSQQLVATYVNIIQSDTVLEKVIEAAHLNCTSAELRKMMSTIHAEEGGFVQDTKGAPDEVLKKCTHYLKDGQPVPMTEEYRQEILAQNKEMAGNALRILAGAERHYAQKPTNQEPDYLEENLCFLGQLKTF